MPNETHGCIISGPLPMVPDRQYGVSHPSVRGSLRVVERADGSADYVRDGRLQRFDTLDDALSAACRLMAGVSAGVER